MQTLYPFLFLTTIVFFSCQAIAKKISGVSDPKSESIASLNQFIQESELGIEDYYLFKESDDFLELMQKKQNVLKVPDMLIFNRDGYLLKETRSCIVSEDDLGKGYIDDLLVNAEIDSTYHIETFQKSLIANTSKGFPQMQESATVYILWAKYGGKKLLQNGFSDIHMVLDNAQEPLQIHHLNIDFRKGWESSVVLGIGN